MAKFNVGDRIRLKQAPRDRNEALSWRPTNVYQVMGIDGNQMKLCQVDATGKVNGSDHYIVESEDSAILANSRSCNYTHTTDFKTGDIVVDKNGRRGRVNGISGIDGSLSVWFDDGRLEKELTPSVEVKKVKNSCSNAVVANALAWKDEKTACNFDAADRVKHRRTNKVGTILREVRGLHGKEAYLVVFDGDNGNTRVEREDLILANTKAAFRHNSKSCNAEIEEDFQRGEKVRFWDGSKFLPATVVIDDGEDVSITVCGKRLTVRKRNISKNSKSCNSDMVEVKRKRSGVKTIVSLDEVRKGAEYGRELTGYERNMLGRGIDKLESDEYCYSVLRNSTTSGGEVVENADWGSAAIKSSKAMTTAIEYLREAMTIVRPFVNRPPSPQTDLAEDRFMHCNSAIKILKQSANSCLNAVVKNALAWKDEKRACNIVKNAVRVSSVGDFIDLLSSIEEDMENPDWGWDWKEEYRLLQELKPYAQKFGKMDFWLRVDNVVRKARNV